MVNTNPYGGAAAGAARDPFGTLEGGNRSISWATKDQWGQSTSVPPGTYHDIEITESPAIRQDTHFEDGPGFKKGDLKFYDDGNPVESFVVTGKVISPTIVPEDENDDMVRTEYFRTQKRRALQDAFKAINVRPGDGFGLGTVIRVTLTGFKPTQGAPQKLYDVQFLKYVPRASAAFGSLEQGQPQPPQQQPGQYVTPTQWAQPTPPVGYPPTPQQQAMQPPASPPPAQPQYVTPANPTFPGQVVPQQAPQAPAQPQQQYAPPAPPAQVAPQQVAAGVPALQAAGYAEIPQQAPQVPAGAAPAVLQAHVDKVTMAVGVGIDRAGAITAVADEVAPGNAEFRAALDQSVPI